MPPRRRQSDVACCGEEPTKGETCPHRESTKPSEKGDWASSALGVDKFHKSGAHKPARWGGENASSQETGVTVAEASIGAGKEFPEGKPYRVDKGLNAARKRARDTMAPLNNRTQLSTYPVGIRNSHS